MSGLYINSRGRRTPLLPPRRTTRSNTQLDDTTPHAEEDLGTRPPRNAPNGKPATRSNLRKRAASVSTDGSTTVAKEGQRDDEDASDEDNSEDEQPASFAPSYSRSGSKAGRRAVVPRNTKIPTYDHNEELFFNSDDDDEVYQKVDEIPDDDEDVITETERREEMEMQQMWMLEADPLKIIPQLDNSSVFDFDDYAAFDSADEFVGFSDSSTTSVGRRDERHVHFPIELDRTRLLSVSVSPLLTRGLHSSLPDIHEADFSLNGDQSNTKTGPVQYQHGDPLQDPYDTDATTEDLPPDAHHMSPQALLQPIEEEEVEASPPSPPANKGKKKAKRSKGPRRGIFTVDVDKPWATLDASCRNVILLPAPMTQRHDWLEQKLRKASEELESSPRKLLDESDGSVASTEDRPDPTLASKSPDIMLASLNSAGHDTANHGQATGPSEAFYPPPGHMIIGDHLVSPSEMALFVDGFSDVTDEADLPFNIEDMIAYDDEGSDDDESPTTPAINMPPLSELSGHGHIHEEFAHLTNQNVTAFRRNADPAQAVLNTTPTFSSFSSTQPAPPQTPTAAGHKRKASTTPYQSAVYNGVTPVQRHVWHPSHKRRKTTT